MEASPPPEGLTSHEFGPRENEVIGDAARWIGFWSWIAILGGVIVGVGSLFTPDVDFGGVIFGLIYVMIGFFFRGSASSMRAVVDTSGADVAHLMDALDRLTAAFRIMVLLVAIGVALALVAMIAVGIAQAGAD